MPVKKFGYIIEYCQVVLIAYIKFLFCVFQFKQNTQINKKI